MQQYGNDYLFNKGMNAKKAQLKKGRLLVNSIWDVLVFNKIKTLFGGKLRAAVCSAGMYVRYGYVTECLINHIDLLCPP